MSRVLCPACGKEIAVKGIPMHTRKCPEWAGKIGTPPSEFNFDKHYKRGLFADDQEEGVDYVQCKLCLAESKDFRKRILNHHLRSSHNMTVADYHEQFPDAPVRLASTLERRKQTTQAKYGVDNVFQAEEVKDKSVQTMLEKHGVTHNQHVPESNAKRAATNLERHGATNPFGSSEVREKIKQTHLERRGVENPNQDPEVIQRRIATNRKRYGVDHFLQTPEFQEKFKATSQDRWGAGHPMQSEEGQQTFKDGFREIHGVDNPFLVPEIQQKAYETNLRNHGGHHSQQCPEVREKAKRTWMEKYGVDNPSKAEEIKLRIKQVWMGKYGVPFPPQSLWVNQTQSFPNKIEQTVDSLSPVNVVYTGDGAYWVQHKGASRARNPDFVVLSAEQLVLYQGGADLNGLRTSAILEVFGDFWHGPKITGKSRREHRREVLDYYAQAGIACLVIWEGDIKKDPKRVAGRIKEFLGSVAL